MSTKVRHSQAYQKLAIAACKAAGLTGCHSPERAAEDAEARQERDDLWAEYEARLRDTQTYTLDEIRAWLTEQKVNVARTSVHRDRRAIMAYHRSVIVAAENARAICDAIDTGDEADLMRGNRVAIAQLIFNTLGELPPDVMEGITIPQLTKLMNTGTQIGKVHAETKILNMKIDEMTKAFDAAVSGAKGKSKTGDGSLSPEQIAQVRAAVFGAS